MSNLQSSNKFIKNKDTKYSLDEIDISENNTTHNDSLHKNKIISKTMNRNGQNKKQANYYLALNTIQRKLNDTFQELSLNEFSKIDKLNTKDKNVSNYIKKPIIKEVIKLGNILQIIKPPKPKKPIISLSNQNNNKYNLIKKNVPSPNIKEDNEEISSTIFNETKISKPFTISNQKENNSNKYNILNEDLSNKLKTFKDHKEYNNNNSTTVTKNKIITEKKSSRSQNNNNKNDNNNGNLHYKLDIINDLEESIDIKANENETKKGKIIQNNPSNIIINQYFELDKNRFLNGSNNRLFNSRIFKSLDFRNIRKNGIINYSIHEIKHSKKLSNVDIIFKNKNTKTTTGKKLRKKYERSELKSNQFLVNSSNKNNKRNYNSSKNEIYLEENGVKDENENKYLTQEQLAKNLMGNFNKCQEDDILENLHFDISEKNSEDEEINEKIEFIDFLSNNDSGNYKSYNNNNAYCSSKNNSNNNDTFIIKTNNEIFNSEDENENGDNNNKNRYYQNKKQEKGNNVNNKLNNNYYNSPVKIRAFNLLPFSNYGSLINKNKKHYKLKGEQNNINNKRNINSNRVNLIPIEQEQKEAEYLDLSESPSYINTLSPNEFDNNTNNKNNINLNDNKLEKNNEKQIEMQHTIYDLEFYQNLLLANNSYKKINFQQIFKNQLPVVNWEERLNVLLWMMKVCEEFAFKRDTFHYSCFYFDLYLYLIKEKIKNKNELKLIGVTCISISAKIEEVQIPKLVEYADLFNNYYKIEDITNIEKKICGTLGWRLIPMTLSSWLNWYTCQWDLFVYSIDDIKNKLLLLTDDENILYFKRYNEVSYYNYRRLYQIIDLIVLDYHSYKYEIRYLIAASFLVSICLHYNLEYDINRKIFKKKRNTLNSKNSYKKDIGKIIKDVYIKFIEQSFDYSFDDKQLNESIKYVYTFISFKFTYDIPLIFQIEQDHLSDYNYEDFISYQTTCDNIYPFFKEMHRKEFKKSKSKQPVKINSTLPKSQSKKSQGSLTISKKNSMKTKKSFSSRKTSLTKDNSKNKISNL